MNLKEGTRRLALLLGVAGAIAGAIASYLALQPLLSQRSRHNRFEQLASSDVVKGANPVWHTKSASKPLAPPAKTYLDEDGNPISPAFAAPPLGPLNQQMTLEQFGQRIKTQYPQYNDLSNRELANKVIAKFPQYAALIEPPSGKKQGILDPDGWKVKATEVDTGSIKTINWTGDFGIESIETEDGQTLYPTELPSRWSYLLICAFPILGFLIPWAVVRAIGWVGAGFVASSK